VVVAVGLEWRWSQGGARQIPEEVGAYDEGMGRDDHTRVGWWVMTHDRAGAALIGSVALAVLVADASYVATDWVRLGDGFLLGLTLLAVAALLAGVLHAGDPERARRNNVVLGALLFASVIAVLGVGKWFAWGALLGELAALGCLFAVVGLRGATKA
jgi:hypothetical protein